MTKNAFSNVLIHHGVKGMKWGIRKKRESGKSKSALTLKEKVKRTSIIGGALAVAAGSIYVGYILRKNYKLKNVSKLKEVGETAAKKILSEPTSIIYASRGKTRGFTFMKTGGVPDPLANFTAGFGDSGSTPNNYFKKFDGKIAATFNDPLGRTDRAGRVIPHNVIIPKNLTNGIETTQDVIDKIWPMIRDTYDPT